MPVTVLKPELSKVLHVKQKMDFPYIANVLKFKILLHKY